MLVGLNLPYSDRLLPESAWRLVERLRPQQFTITSFAHEETVARLCRDFRDATFHIRPRTGPGHGVPWPSGILDYRSWPTERSLGECIEQFRRSIPANRVKWVGGNEPELELPPPPDWNDMDRYWQQQRDAMALYSAWYLAEVREVRRQFPDIPCAVAPIGQGDPNREWAWFQHLAAAGCYMNAQYLADHNYFGGSPFDDENWGSRARALLRFLPQFQRLDNLETNDNGEFFAQDPGERATRYAAYVNYCAATGLYDSVSLFTLWGAPDDERKPAWWFLHERTVEAAARYWDFGFGGYLGEPFPGGGEPGGGGPGPEPEPAPVQWYQNHRETGLWSNPHADAVEFTRVPQWSYFEQVAPQEGGRIFVRYFGNATSQAGEVWVDAADLGPVAPPASYPPAEPDWPAQPEPEPEPGGGEPHPGGGGAPGGFPLPEWIPHAQHIIEGTLDVAEEENLPPVLAMALMIAESRLTKFDRWHKWTGEALEAIARRDKAALRAILARCAALGTNDISFGPAHQAFWWSPERVAWGITDPYDLDAILRFRQKYIQDHGHAIRVALRQLARYWRDADGDMLAALCRYNKPNVDPALNANRGNYANALAEAPGYLPSEPRPLPVEDWQPTIYLDAGFVGGWFPGTPEGVILHGSRSGVEGRALSTEFNGTRNWARTNPLGLGWNVTVGEGEISIHMDPRQWGHHARAASDNFLSVEFAQPTASYRVTDLQVETFAWWLKARVFPVYPDLPLNLITHAEIERMGRTGVIDGKSDAYPFGDGRADDLRARIMAALADTPEPPDQGEDMGRIAELEALLAQREHQIGELHEELRADRDLLGVATVNIADAFAVAVPKYHESAERIVGRAAALAELTRSTRMRAGLAEIAEAGRNVTTVTDGDIVPALDALRRLREE